MRVICGAVGLYCISKRGLYVTVLLSVHVKKILEKETLISPRPRSTAKFNGVCVFFPSPSLKSVHSFSSDYANTQTHINKGKKKSCFDTF